MFFYRINGPKLIENVIDEDVFFWEEIGIEVKITPCEFYFPLSFLQKRIGINENYLRKDVPVLELIKSIELTLTILRIFEKKAFEKKGEFFFRYDKLETRERAGLGARLLKQGKVFIGKNSLELLLTEFSPVCFPGAIGKLRGKKINGGIYFPLSPIINSFFEELLILQSLFEQFIEQQIIVEYVIEE